MQKEESQRVAELEEKLAKAEAALREAQEKIQKLEKENASFWKGCFV